MNRPKNTIDQFNEFYSGLMKQEEVKMKKENPFLSGAESIKRAFNEKIKRTEDDTIADVKEKLRIIEINLTQRIEEIERFLNL